MTIAHDADTRWPASGSDTTTGDRTFTHTPAGTPAGVVVVLCSNLLVAACTGIQYDGVAMSLVATGINSNEDGLVEVYTLTDVAIPTGAKTVTIQGATAAGKFATCSTATATTGRTTVDTANHKDEALGTNPSMDLSTTVTTLSYGGYEHGDANPLATPIAGCTNQHSLDFGAKVCGTLRRTSPDASGTVTLGYTFATSEDYTMAAVALAEAAAAIDLVVQDAAQAHAVDSPTLTQVHILTVADASHTHTADSAVLTQVHALIVDDATQAHTADNVTLESGGITLQIQDSIHTQTADTPTLTQVHNLAIADATQGHTAGSPTLTQAHQLVTQDALHGHTVELVTVAAIAPYIPIMVGLDVTTVAAGGLDGVLATTGLDNTTTPAGMLDAATTTTGSLDTATVATGGLH